MMIERRALAAFLGLTFLLDWGLLGAYLGLGGAWEQPASTLVLASYMLAPALVAAFVQRRVRRRPVKELGLGLRPNRWWLVAWLGPLALALVATGVGFLLPGVSFDPSMADLMARFEGIFSAEQMAEMRAQTASLPLHPFWLSLLQGLIAGATLNAVFAFGEELGWRGLLQRLLAPLGFWRGSALVGAIWGIWHAPAILLGHNYPEHPVAGVAMMTIWCVLLAPPFAWVRARTGSTVAPAVMHGTLNACAGLPLMVTHGGDDLRIGLTGLAGFVPLVAVNLWILVTGAPELTNDAPAPESPP
ncbi:MAG: CPBP family intramembrane metalloprotease [Myxococcales bacterium]|nr:CPBP family intramembrane metalloprotease [Myxococcales bacterium]